MEKSRLLQMLFILLEKGSVTAPELAEQFEVSVRTIYRDIDRLSEAGIPVYTSQGKNGGIFIQENYVLNKSFISEQEQKQILLALQGLQVATEENTSELLAKLSGVFKRQHVDWIEIDFSEWTKKSEDLFELLQQAIFTNKSIKFTYFNGNGQKRQRTADPLKLVFKSNSWYLYAYCHFRESNRLFKLSRIKELSVTDAYFTQPVPKKVLQEMNLYTEKKIELSLLFDSDLAFHVHEYFDAITLDEHGNFLVTISLPDTEHLYRFLLSFGDKVEVKSPPAVREKILATLQNAQNKYKT